MARIDELLDQIADDALRTQLRSAVGNLRRRKKFGLVFDEHVPESVLLASQAGLRVGSEVAVRTDPAGKSRYTVIEIDDTKATITDGDTSRVEETRDLLVVVPFGEPVYPVLRPCGEPVVRAPLKPSHTVINGENFHALQLLLFAYKGKVDCIYIDPPYNTGDRDWKYNNNYVDNNDGWRHSKWLSFMEKRLRLAKQLLKSDGVLIVTIDENELGNLSVLLAEKHMFADARRQLVTICINPSGASGDGLSRVEEYAMFCFLGDAQPVPALDDMLSNNLEEVSEEDQETVRWESLLRRGNAWYRPARPNLCYPVFVNPKTGRIVDVGQPFNGEDESLREQRRKGAEAAWPVRKDGKLGIWRVDGKRLRELVDKGYAYASARDEKRGTWSLKYLMTGQISAIEDGSLVVTKRGPKGEAVLGPAGRRGRTAKTMWKRGRHTAGGNGGTQLVSELLGERNLFSFPKSVYAVQDCLQVAIGDRKNALVVDFFGGSGTTANAVMLMNRADGGSRRSIVITNNEVDEARTNQLNDAGYFLGDAEFDRYGICRLVTMPRIRAAISGTTTAGRGVPGKYLDGVEISKGFDENAVFFDLVYEDRDDIDVGSRFTEVLPALWLAAGAIGDPTSLSVGDDWLLTNGIPFAVLLDEDRFAAFRKALEGREDVTHVWLVTDSDAAFARMRDQIGGRRTVEMLYRDYLRSFRINTEHAQ